MFEPSKAAHHGKTFYYGSKKPTRNNLIDGGSSGSFNTKSTSYMNDGYGRDSYISYNHCPS